LEMRAVAYREYTRSVGGIRGARHVIEWAVHPPVSLAVEERDSAISVQAVVSRHAKSVFLERARDVSVRVHLKPMSSIRRQVRRDGRHRRCCCRSGKEEREQ
jgi:hypothetical protein